VRLRAQRKITFNPSPRISRASGTRWSW
jgi:hypothetical protein